jgi:hypothetical protein
MFMIGDWSPIIWNIGPVENRAEVRRNRDRSCTAVVPKVRAAGPNSGVVVAGKPNPGVAGAAGEMTGTCAGSGRNVLGNDRPWDGNASRVVAVRPGVVGAAGDTAGTCVGSALNALSVDGPCVVIASATVASIAVAAVAVAPGAAAAVVFSCARAIRAEPTAKIATRTARLDLIVTSESNLGDRCSRRRGLSLEMLPDGIVELGEFPQQKMRIRQRFPKMRHDRGDGTSIRA